MVLKTEVLLYYVFDHGETISIGVHLYWPGCTFVMETQFPRAEVKHFTTEHFERIFDECIKELDRKHQAGELRYIKAIPWEFYELDAAKVRESCGTISCTDYESMKQTNGMKL